jgi:hypothetical protein
LLSPQSRTFSHKNWICCFVMWLISAECSDWIGMGRWCTGYSYCSTSDRFAERRIGFWRDPRSRSRYVRKEQQRRPEQTEEMRS